MNTWVKSYASILDNQKIARLPDYLWRCRHELELLARQYDNGGKLPSVEDIAWYLRIDESKLAERLYELSRDGEVAQDEQGWLIPDFDKEQKVRGRAYKLVNTELIFNTFEIWQLAGDGWRKWFIEYHNSRPVHYEYGYSPMRRGWQCIRKIMTKKVFERDKHTCRYCGATNRLEIDHIIPLSRGGSNELDNLQILCRYCNSRKWAK